MPDPGASDRPSDDRPGAVSRRGFLAIGAGSIGVVGAGRAVDNTLLGYGHFGWGTNLLDQDLPRLIRRFIRPTYDETVNGTRIEVRGRSIVLSGMDRRLLLGSSDPDRVRAIDDDRALDGRLTALYDDGSQISTEAYRFEFYDPSAFFDRVADARYRPEAVALLRGRFDRAVTPGVVAEFTGVDPADPRALVPGLRDAFRQYSRYDVARYLAGSIQDNVIFGAHDLRQYFLDPTDFRSLMAAGTTGMFCWEYVDRSMEALQAVSPWAQSIPVAACYVTDYRHKHAFTGLATAIQDDGLVLPVTFVDYTWSTLNDDFRLRAIRGEGLAAYDSSHRADTITW